jgi:hypothetical protein
MNMENQLLVTDGPVEVEDFINITHHLRGIYGIYGIYFNSIKNN